LEEAEYQAEQGRSIEVIDLRTLVPWDRAVILESLAKTNRLLVLHEAQMTAGFGAEIAAAIAEEGFDLLDAPPTRVAGEDLPIPFSKTLESKIYSARSRLREALSRLLAF
jgi:2-oxoisovalerate dehydrogenase E1 component